MSKKRKHLPGGFSKEGAPVGKFLSPEEILANKWKRESKVENSTIDSSLGGRRRNRK